MLAGVAEILLETLRRKLSRLLVVELDLAGTGGTLHGGSRRGALAGVPRPGVPGVVLARLGSALSDPARPAARRGDLPGRAAAAELARRFGRDRPVLCELAGTADDELSAVAFGEGDSHRGGRSVALLDLQGQLSSTSRGRSASTPRWPRFWAGCSGMLR